MERVVRIDETDVTMRATAATLIRYRGTFNRDLIRDLQEMQATEGGEMAPGTAETISRLAYIMDTGKDRPAFNEWLEQFSPFGVLLAGPEILGLWTDSQRTQVVGKKK